MKIIKTKFEGLNIIENFIFQDNRGKFVKVFNEEEFKQNNLNFKIAESFYSISYKNIIRGMHFQIPPYAHIKLVYVISGKILDVVVDLRKSSLTYKKNFSLELSDENNRALFIPKGFAHGFKTLTETATVVYMTSTIHNQECDKGILWNSFGFDWGIENPIISERDKTFPSINEFE